MPSPHPVRWTPRISFFDEMELRGPVKARFSIEDRRVTLRNIRLVAILAAILVPFFSVVDFFAYREHFALFLGFRLTCTLLVLLIWRISQHPLGKRYFRVFTILLPLVPAFFIALMIGISQDPGSPYYAGLSLCIVAIGFVFHWTYREALISSISIFLMYLLACLPGMWRVTDEADMFAFINNLVFIFATGLVITSGSFAHHKIRVGEFFARHELQQSQNALTANNLELCSLLAELNKAEQQLIQSDKLASLGQISAGVIHEIGNPLNFSNQALFLLRKKFGRAELDDVPEIIDDMQEGFDRIIDIVAELREFSHQGGRTHSWFFIDDSIHSALRILSKQIETHHISVTLEIDQTPEIFGVKNQMTQVIMNLVQNAIHAITEVDRNRPGHITISASVKGDSVRIRIIDNGSGIDPQTTPRLFDPFFTTKKPGEGTGLGLSIGYRIIESHHGTIEVDSVPDQSTCFTITLPKRNLTHQKTA